MYKRVSLGDGSECGGGEATGVGRKDSAWLVASEYGLGGARIGCWEAGRALGVFGGAVVSGRSLSGTRESETAVSERA